ncbi:hypothetical protein Z043_120835 [Scleropages formosus]|uniref:Uncharacterized protein n=1 Tax=Scleropages formosus TaxID=113540 RepID=A0A0P7WD92_SCLFO|nr:hypothetical protein Z043_120835 [Scleropages formosus]
MPRRCNRLHGVDEARRAAARAGLSTRAAPGPSRGRSVSAAPSTPVVLRAPGQQGALMVPSLVEAETGRGALDIKASLEHIMSLLPGKLWSDTVPRIALKHQLYSLHRDRTRVDRHLTLLKYIA